MQLQKDRDQYCSWRLYNLTYSPWFYSLYGAAPSFSLAQPWLYVNVSVCLFHSHSRTLLRFWLAPLELIRRRPDANSRENPMWCDGPTRSILELYTILRTSRSPQPDVQSPGVDITLTVDVACWWFALLCKPLAKPTALRTGDQRLIYSPHHPPRPTPSSKCPRKFQKSLCEIWRRQTALGIYQHNVPAPPAYN